MIYIRRNRHHELTTRTGTYRGHSRASVIRQARAASLHLVASPSPTKAAPDIARQEDWFNGSVPRI